MKIPYAKTENFVKSPDPNALAILVYGPDHGLVKERSKIIAATVTDNPSDPFNVAVLSPALLSEDPARLSDEANALSMMGGRRLIKIEEASDKITPLLKDYLTSPNDQALVLVEAGELGPGSSLRKLCESAKNAAAIACYVEDERDMARLVRQTLSEEGLQADSDAVNWLAAAITGDRAKARAELNKLITYKSGDKSAITLADVQAVCGQAGAQSLDDLVMALGERRAEAALKAYDTLLEEGMAEIAILRAMQNHYRRLHEAACMINEGESSDLAMKKLKPPVFFKVQDSFRRQLNSWSGKALLNVLARLAALEKETKSTNAPVQVLIGQVITGLCSGGRARSHG